MRPVTIELNPNKKKRVDRASFPYPCSAITIPARAW